MNICSAKDRKWLINSVKKYNTNKKRVKEVIAFVKDNGGIEYTTKKMLEYQQKAFVILEKYPKSEYKDALMQLVNYVIDRKI